MFGAIGLLAPLLIVLFSAVRVRGGGCVLLAKWNRRPLLAVKAWEMCKYSPDFSPPKVVTYFPPDDSHGPPRILIAPTPTDGFVNQLHTLFDNEPEESGVIEKQMIEMTDFTTEEKANSWLRRTLRIQCTLVFESPDSLRISRWFVIMDLSVACSEFLEMGKFIPQKVDFITTAVTLETGDTDTAPRHLLPVDTYRLYRGLGELQLIRDDMNPNEDVIRYRTLAALSEVRTFLDMKVTRTGRRLVEPADLSKLNGGREDGRMKLRDIIPFFLLNLLQRPNEDVKSKLKGRVTARVDIAHFGQSGKSKKISIAARLANWDENWPTDSNVVGSTRGVEDLFQKTAMDLDFLRCDMETDRTCENAHQLKMTEEDKQALWSGAISKFFAGDNSRHNELYRQDQSYIRISLGFVENHEAAKAWMKSVLSFFKVRYSNVVQPYKYGQSGSRSGGRRRISKAATQPGSNVDGSSSSSTTSYGDGSFRSESISSRSRIGSLNKGNANDNFRSKSISSHSSNGSLNKGNANDIPSARSNTGNSGGRKMKIE